MWATESGACRATRRNRSTRRSLGGGVYLALDTTFRLAEHIVRTTGCFWRPGSGASMRLGTVRIHGGAPRAVGLVDGHVIDLGEAAFDLGLIGSTFPGSVRELLELKPYTDPLIADLEQAVLGRDDVGSASWAYSLDEVTFMSPVAPGKVLLVGGNHQGSQTQPIKPEIQDEWPRPMYFMKPGSSVLGHGGTGGARPGMGPGHPRGRGLPDHRAPGQPRQPRGRVVGGGGGVAA